VKRAWIITFSGWGKKVLDSLFSHITSKNSKDAANVRPAVGHSIFGKNKIYRADLSSFGKKISRPREKAATKQN